MALHADKVVIRTLAPSDKEAIIAIDQAVSGRQRTNYIESKLVWATEDKGVPLAEIFFTVGT